MSGNSLGVIKKLTRKIVINMGASNTSAKGTKTLVTSMIPAANSTIFTSGIIFMRPNPINSFIIAESGAGGSIGIKVMSMRPSSPFRPNTTNAPPNVRDKPIFK